MNRKTYVIGDVLTDASVGCVYHIDGTDIITAEIFENEVYNKYYEREFFAKTDNGANDLIALWEHYVVVNDYSLKRMWEVITAEYNPTSNYDKLTTITTEFMGSESDTSTINGTRINQLVKGESVTEQAVSPYDSSDYYNQTKVNEHSTTDTNTESYNEYSNINKKEYDDRKNVVTEETTGNIGVRSMAEDLERELDFRKKTAFAEMIIQAFVDKYTFYR